MPVGRRLSITGLDDASRWRIVGKLEADQSQVICSMDFRVMRNVLSTLWNQFTEKGTMARLPSQGSKRATKSVQDRYLRLLAKRDKSAKATPTSRNLYNAA
ncbi:HTH_Tnp_Tc3_2 domain-containing protein [Trichonephila clavipes]|nr:HTH_Tnp_Tc3_2 domain-containing protein [Trichonephila clavipes]